MKDNKSPGVDGISPKILKETVEQISAPLAHVFSMSIQEGIVTFEKTLERSKHYSFIQTNVLDTSR